MSAVITLISITVIIAIWTTIEIIKEYKERKFNK